MKILALAPSRIGIIGGGTDIPSYYENYGGKVINMAINLRQHMEIFIGEDLYGHNGQNIFPYKADPKLVYEIFTKYGLGSMHHVGIRSSFDGIIKAGLGSSGSASVCLIAALQKMQEKSFNRYSIAEEAWDIEVNGVGWYGGKQDQYASAFGGLNLIEFGKNVSITPFSKEDAGNLQEWMMLFYTRGMRESKTIQSGFKQLTKEQKKALDQIKKRVNVVEIWIRSDYIEGVGEILNEVWEFKKKLNKGVSNARINAIYDYALKHGAIGGKILGAGGGGYMMFVCNPNKQEELTKEMAKEGIEKIDFSPDFNGVEARIL